MRDQLRGRSNHRLNSVLKVVGGKRAVNAKGETIDYLLMLCNQLGEIDY